MSTSEEKLNNEREILDIQKEMLSLMKKRQGIEEKTLEDSYSISNGIKDQLKELSKKGKLLEHQQTTRKTILNLTNEATKLAEKNYTTTSEEFGLKKHLLSLKKDEASIDKNILLQNHQINTLKKDANRMEEDEAEAALRLVESLEIQVASLTATKGEIKEILELSGEVANNFGVKAFGGVSDIAKMIPGLSRFSEPFENAAEAARSQATTNLETFGTTKNLSLEDQKSVNNKLDAFQKMRGEGMGIQDAMKKAGVNSKQVKFGKLPGKKGLSPLMVGIKSLGPALAKALGPAAILFELGKALLEADSQIVGLQKSMALSNVEAVQFKSSLSLAAASSGELSVTGTKLLKTFTDLNAQFGFITNFSTDTLVTMTKLTEVVKLSSEAAGSLAGASLVTGDNFEDNYKNALGTSYELQRQSGVQFDLKGILEETGKVTGTVRANLGGSVERMAEAVTEAKLLGASLDQVAKAGGALLDFQSSIKSEMEAELLTGKQLNLEAARHAALTGDQATLAKELKENMGDFSEFSEMNVIQQNALAAAMGMQSDEMADILFQQEVQGKSAKDLRALGKEELANRLEQKTAQDKFNDAVSKLKDLFVDVMQTLQPILQVFGKIFEVVGAIVKFLKPIQSTLVGAATGFAVGGPWGAAVGAVIGAGMDVANTIETGDLISPASGKTQISTKEGGLFELSKNDDLMAGPNIASNSNNSTSNISMDITPIVDEISQLRREMNSLLTTIANKDSSVYMDGNRVGKSLALGSSNMGA